MELVHEYVQLENYFYFDYTKIIKMKIKNNILDMKKIRPIMNMTNEELSKRYSEITFEACDIVLRSIEEYDDSKFDILCTFFSVNAQNYGLHQFRYAYTDRAIFYNFDIRKLFNGIKKFVLQCCDDVTITEDISKIEFDYPDTWEFITPINEYSVNYYNKIAGGKYENKIKHSLLFLIDFLLVYANYYDSDSDSENNSDFGSYSEY